ncbi:phage baseplate protein [Cetobacterium somerae]|uniref:phage baseplate protein n=1 Tax=Cetobacterium somerae TaxID=188913 RepID=UPI00248DDACA|nr:hypothetical protein [Cetobacterium somerae]
MSKEEKQIKEIIDNDLDTGRDLVTENYQLEILTLKDKVDLRRFSRAFLKVDKLLKNIFSNKLDKGKYGGSAQDLKNDIDTKISKDGDTIKKLGSYDYKRLVVPEIVGIDINQGTTTTINTIAVEITNGWKASMLSFDLIVRAYTGSNCDTTIRFNGYTYSTNKTWVNTRAYIIGYRHNGVKVYTTTHPNGNPLIYFNFNGYLDYCNCMISNILESVPNTYKIYSIQGATGDLVPTSYMYSTTFKPTPKDINAVNIAGDTMTGVLSLPRLRTTTDEGTLISRLDKDFIGYSSQRGAYIGGVSSTGVSRFFYSGSDTSRPCIRIGSNYYSLYHEGLKPNLEDVGAANFGLGSSATQKNPKNEKFGGFWRDTNLNSSGITMPYDGTPIINFFRVNRSNQIPYTGTSTNGSEITWNKLYSENSKPTTSELGAVSKTGDIMTGSLKIKHSDGLIVEPDSTQGAIIIRSVNGIASFRYGGAGPVSAGGFNVVGVNDIVKFRVDDSGECYAKGTSKIYHQGFKPTKVDVGLDQVQNYPITSSVTDSSEIKYASAKAVKQAHDKAIEANNNISKFCPYRVGDILQTTNTEHPATNWTGTQWERYGEGKVIVGLSSSETEFNSVGKTGGTKTESLTEAQNGPHGHTVTSVISGSGWYGQGGALGGMGAIKTTSSGTGAPHNNLQPYIVAYRWRRIA